MRIRSRPHPKISVLVLLLVSIIFFVPGTFSSGFVTLESIQIFKTHEWLAREPTVYFRCQGENKTMLPDVKKTYFLYAFKGAESWQPLTELSDNKCKRCGLYEEGVITSYDVFDEWELCPDDFRAPYGKYTQFKDKEFNATFMCPQCTPGSVHFSRSKDWADAKGINVAIVILITAVVSGGSVIGAVALCRYWQRKKERTRPRRIYKDF